MSLALKSQHAGKSWNGASSGQMCSSSNTPHPARKKLKLEDEDRAVEFAADLCGSDRAMGEKGPEASLPDSTSRLTGKIRFTLADRGRGAQPTLPPVRQWRSCKQRSLVFRDRRGRIGASEQERARMSQRHSSKGRRSCGAFSFRELSADAFSKCMTELKPPKALSTVSASTITGHSCTDTGHWPCSRGAIDNPELLDKPALRGC